MPPSIILPTFICSVRYSLLLFLLFIICPLPSPPKAALRVGGWVCSGWASPMSCVVTVDLPSRADIFTFVFWPVWFLMRVSFLSFFLVRICLYFLTAFLNVSLYSWVSAVYYDKSWLITFYSACIFCAFCIGG